MKKGSKRKSRKSRLRGGNPNCLGQFDIFEQDTITEPDSAVLLTNSNGVINCFNVVHLYAWYKKHSPDNLYKLKNPVTQETISKADAQMLQQEFLRHKLEKPSQGGHIERTSYGYKCVLFDKTREVTLTIFSRYSPKSFIMTVSDRPDKHYVFEQLTDATVGPVMIDIIKKFQIRSLGLYVLYEYNALTGKKNYMLNVDNLNPFRDADITFFYIFKRYNWISGIEIEQLKSERGLELLEFTGNDPKISEVLAELKRILDYPYSLR